MSKKICKEEDKKIIGKLAKKAGYECKSCGAEAVKEKYLCKPKKI
jgi:transposase-like protein